MTYDVVPKVYEIDYSFIIKNYLNPSLWEKEWNLYIYKELVFSLQLDSIDCKNSSICFRINVKSNNSGYNNFTYINHYTKNSNIIVLKKQINGKIFELLGYYEKYQIKKTTGYKNLVALYDDEDDNLRQIATDFLDMNGVTNDTIREVYIDDFVSKNRKRFSAEDTYVSAYTYITLPDYFLTFTKIAKDDVRYNTCYEKIVRNLDVDVIHELTLEGEKVYNADSEWYCDMESQLEAI